MSSQITSHTLSQLQTNSLYLDGRETAPYPDTGARVKVKPGQRGQIGQVGQKRGQVGQKPPRMLRLPLLSFETGADWTGWTAKTN